MINLPGAPEYYLSWASKTGVSLEEARPKYYSRIEQAFQQLETEVERGRIRFYGISSNTFPSPADDPEFTSLEKVWGIAQSLSPEHHFRLIQLPMNLFETGGITERNQSNGRSVLQFAQEKQIGVLINRPLNAIIANRLIRLAEVQAVQAVSTEEISQLIDDLIHSEEVLKREILPEFSLTPSLQAQVVEQVALGGVLKRNNRGRISSHFFGLSGTGSRTCSPDQSQSVFSRGGLGRGCDLEPEGIAGTAFHPGHNHCTGWNAPRIVC
jgi:hypothetical protein